VVRGDRNPDPDQPVRAAKQNVTASTMLHDGRHHENWQKAKQNVTASTMLHDGRQQKGQPREGSGILQGNRTGIVLRSLLLLQKYQRRNPPKRRREAE